RSVNDGILHAVSSSRASIAVVAAATQAWLPTLLGAAQHGLVASSPIPVALVRAGSTEPERVVLMLSASQSKRPASATLLATRLARRLSSSGLSMLVVTAAGPVDQIGELLGGKAEVVVASPTEWIGEHAGASDLLVAPG